MCSKSLDGHWQPSEPHQLIIKGNKVTVTSKNNEKYDLIITEHAVKVQDYIADKDDQKLQFRQDGEGVVVVTWTRKGECA